MNAKMILSDSQAPISHKLSLSPYAEKFGGRCPVSVTERHFLAKLLRWLTFALVYALLRGCRPSPAIQFANLRLFGREQAGVTELDPRGQISGMHMAKSTDSTPHLSNSEQSI